MLNNLGQQYGMLVDLQKLIATSQDNGLGGGGVVGGTDIIMIRTTFIG